jgi:hypothetical protein
METAVNTSELNKEIKEALIPVLARFDKLAIGRVRIISVETTRDVTNPPGHIYRILIQAQTVEETPSS